MVEAPVDWETARLVARRAMPDAATALFEAYAQDPEVARYMIWRPIVTCMRPGPSSIAASGYGRTVPPFPWTLWMKDDGSLAGMIEARCGEMTS